MREVITVENRSRVEEERRSKLSQMHVWSLSRRQQRANYGRRGSAAQKPSVLVADYEQTKRRGMVSMIKTYSGTLYFVLRSG